MMTAFLASICLILGALIASVEVHRMRAKQPIDALTFFNGAYFLFFVFVPLNVLVLGEAAVRQKYAYQTWSHGDIWTALALLLSYAVFVLGYYRRGRNGGAGADARQLSTRIASWLAGIYVLVGVMALAYL